MLYTWDVFLEEADSDAPAQWIGTTQADTMGQALEKAAQFYEHPSHDLVVKQQPTSAEQWDAQAIEKAVDQAPHDMIATPVRSTGARLYSKKNVVGSDLVVQGLRWYVEVDLINLNDETTAAALYRIWYEKGQWKAVRVELY
jgi:hypothetical protein